MLDKKLTDISLKYCAEDFSRYFHLWLDSKRGESFTWDEILEEFFNKKI